MLPNTFDSAESNPASGDTADNIETVSDTSTPVETALASDSGMDQTLRGSALDVPPQNDNSLLPVVGLGGSAGSIEALRHFFSRIPANLGMAYVVVVHIPEESESSLAQILQTRTSMPVIQVRSRTKLEADRVYVIPPTHFLAMNDGHIHLIQRQQERGKRVAVDLFFRSLAATHRSKSVAVVLSGMDGDGAIGIKVIKENGGVTVAQDPDEAEFDGMPRAAIESGMIDWILPVEQIAQKLTEFIKNERNIHLPPSESPARTEGDRSNINPEDDDEAALREVLAFLRARTSHDFSHYKRATVLRRITRRLQVNSLESIPSYANFLRTHPGEAGALLQDLLISVTNFFRDPEAFWALGNYITPLFRDKGNRENGDSVRVWVPGCATGEEAYSLAMLLLEHSENLDNPPEIQIFATDLDDSALRTAREGIYPATIAADVSPERLRRFFVLDQGRYRVKKEVRERILFAPHNLLKDSPFSRLDLISCRNLMIYFDRVAQDRVLEIFHFALRANGLLFLGSSESAEENPLFSALDKKYRIYERQGVARSQFPLSILPLPTIPRLPEISPLIQLAPPSPPVLQLPPPPMPRPEESRTLSYNELHLRLLEESAPPSILVNHNYEIVHLSEHAGRYLRFAAGEVTMDLLAVIPSALRLELRAALFRAVQGGESVEVPGVPVEINGDTRILGAKVRPMRSENEASPSAFVLVIFDEQDTTQQENRPNTPVTPEPIAARLEAELQHLKTYLRASIEQYEASSEELKASNEELQAMNEEQRSASEELETSREEIQAANEELVTLNAELKTKVEEISRANSDLQNLMASTDIATIFLSKDLRIKKYTPHAVELFNLIPTDTGRPLADLRHRFTHDDLIVISEQVVRTLITSEQEISTNDGRWFLLRISPYRTAEDKIDGVVLTFLDITRRKEAEAEVKRAHDELEERVKARTQELSDEIIRRQHLEKERQQLTQRSVTVQEEERQRISRELHDNMGQHLVAITMKIQELQKLTKQKERAESSSNPEVMPELMGLQEMVDELTHIAHNLAWELRPAILDNLGLEAALREYVAQWQTKHNTTATFASDISSGRSPISGEVATTLYRIVQEALTNVARHAEASQVSVILNQRPNLITAVIEDNGKGYNTEISGKPRLGILGMHERMALVGGELQTESSPNTGTTIYARVPLTD